MSYDCTKGKGGSWTKGDDAALTFTFERSLDDESTFGLFTGIEVDGVAVPQKSASGGINYKAESGSLVLHLQPSFLGTLDKGSHEVTANFEDGSSSASFTVKPAPENEPESKSAKASESKTAKASESKLAKTGDGAPIAPLLATSVVAALALVLTLRRKRA